MPITDHDSDATESRISNPILDAIDFDTLSFDGLSSGDVARIQRQRAMIETHAKAGKMQPLGDTIDAVGATMKSASAAAQVLFAERIDRAASVDDRLFVHAGFALAAAGYKLWCERRNAEALPFYERATQRLADSTLDRAMSVWGDAMVARAVLVRDRSIDETQALALALIDRAERVENRGLRFWALFGARRAAEQCTLSKRWSDAIAISKRGLAIPFAHMKPIPSWYEARVFMHSRAMVSHRELGQNEEVIALARAAERDCEHVTSDTGLLEVCWILTEAAFVAADRMGDSALALTFIRLLRDRETHPRANVLAAELAYGIAMEAKANQLLGRSDQALRACEEAIAWAQRPAKPEHAHSAFAEALCIRASLYEQRGERALAIATWREVLERFGESDSESVRGSLVAARDALSKS